MNYLPQLIKLTGNVYSLKSLRSWRLGKNFFYLLIFDIGRFIVSVFGVVLLTCSRKSRIGTPVPILFVFLIPTSCLSFMISWTYTSLWYKLFLTHTIYFLFSIILLKKKHYQSYIVNFVQPARCSYMHLKFHISILSSNLLYSLSYSFISLL